MISTPISFFSLTLASVDVFYSLRLGRFSDFYPTLKMTILVMPFIIILISGPLLSIILMATFFNEYVIVFVASIIFLNTVVMKLLYFRKADRKNIKKIYHINNKANVRFDELARQESSYIFLTSVFTSWITPCTVWYNNFEMKSYYLLILSWLTLTYHALSIVFHCVVINKFPQIFPTNLSLFHCFGNETNTTYRPVFQGNSSLIEICFDCLPPLTFCSPIDGPRGLFNFYIAPFALTLLTLSALSAAALQVLGHYYVLYRWSYLVFCKSPIVHLSLLTDFMENSSKLPVKMVKELTDILNTTIESPQGQNYFVIDNGDALADSKNLMFFAMEFKFTGVVCRLIGILKYLNFEDRGKKYLQHVYDSVSEKGSIWVVDHTIVTVLKDALSHDWVVKNMVKVWRKQSMLKHIKKKNVKMVCFLHMLGADLDISNETGQMASKILLKMIQDDQIKLDKIGEFLKAYINRFLHRPSRNNLLQTAVLHGYAKSVQTLLNLGADVNYRESLNGQDCLHLAASKGRIEILQLLLKNKGLHVNTEDISRRTPLHYSAENGHKEAVKVLVEYKAEVDMVDKGGKTPLYLSAAEGHSEIVAFLCENGASLNSKADDGSTPLHQAALFGHTEIAKSIVQRNEVGYGRSDGTKIAPMTKEEFQASVNVKDEDGTTALHLAARLGNLEITTLLIQKGAAPDERDLKGWTPLLLAVANDLNSHINVDICKLLIDNGANVKQKTKKKFGKKTALHYASEQGCTEIAKILIARGTKFNANDKDGWRPLHFAAKGGHEDIVKLLMEKKATVNITNKSQRTPLMLAADENHFKIIDSLTC